MGLAPVMEKPVMPPMEKNVTTVAGVIKWRDKKIYVKRKSKTYERSAVHKKTICANSPCQESEVNRSSAESCVLFELLLECSAWTFRVLRPLRVVQRLTRLLYYATLFRFIFCD